MLSGFWSAPRILEENVKFYPTFHEKSFIKGTLKQTIEKGLCYPFFTIFAGKKTQILVKEACGDQIVLISQMFFFSWIHLYTLSYFSNFFFRKIQSFA